ncbi:MAG: FtsX-like permease family protein [Bacteroidales bacterium]
MKYIAKELRRHLYRTIGGISGYTLASFFVLIILSISGSNKSGSTGILQNTGTHLVVYIPTDKSICRSDLVKGAVIAEGMNTLMLDMDLLYTIEKIAGVKDAAPYLRYEMYHDDYEKYISIGGIDTSSLATSTSVCAPSNIVDGRFLSGLDNEILAEEAFTKAHGLTVGDTLKIFNGKKVLTGIVNSGIKPAKADFYATIGNVRYLLQENLQCQAPGFDMNIVLVEVEDPRVQDHVIGEIRSLMHNFSVSTFMCYEPAYKVMNMINKTSSGLSLMIFIFLVLFSAKTQLTAIFERYREIGILKSLGWSDSRIGMQIISISVIQATIGLVIGFILGVVVINLLNNQNLMLFDYIEFRFKYSFIPIVFLLSVTGALIASMFPIYRIFRTKAGDIFNRYM